MTATFEKVLLCSICALLALATGCGGGVIGGGDPTVDDPWGGKQDQPFAPEQCDGLDNDGDGEVDESCACAPGAAQACYPGPPATRGVGRCADGQQSCGAGGEFSSWGTCEGAAVPEVEVCGDGIDNDCNGQVDDAPGCLCDAGQTEPCYSGPPGTEGVGQCKAGEKTCNPAGSEWATCQGEVLPDPEVCDDKIDNDCDGEVDEGCTSAHVPQLCSTATLTHATGAVDCAPNQAVYMMDDGNGPNFICCPLPATDILSSAPPQVRAGQCGPNEVITGAVGQFSFKCTAINTERYSIASAQKPCYFGSGWAGGSGVAKCASHPASFSVLQQSLFGSDGCSGYPYGALFVKQTGKDCEDMLAVELRYTGKVAGDAAGAPVVMFQP